MSWTTGEALAIGSRKEQQDRVGILCSADGRRLLLTLADGLGGHLGGALAAQLVVDTAASRFDGQALDNPQEFLESLCQQAHRAICALNPNETLSPHSTCAFLYLSGPEAYWAHVGDSRLYHYRGGKLLTRTADHSVRQLMLSQGEIEENSDAARCFQNQLYKSLGGNEPPQPDFGATAVEPDDLFVLCSDGLWQAVEADQIINALGASGVAQNSAGELVQLALRQSENECDNVSVALAQWKDEPSNRRGLLKFLKRMFSFRYAPRLSPEQKKSGP